MSIQRMGRTLAIAGMTAAVAACAATGAGGSGADAKPATVITVENRNWSDINVHVVREGTTSRQRLGMVTSMTTERFEVPDWMMAGSSAIRLIADPIGSKESYVTAPIQVSPEQTVAWTVESNLDLSSWTIR